MWKCEIIYSPTGLLRYTVHVPDSNGYKPITDKVNKQFYSS